MADRMELYKAVKYEVANFREDCGFGMVDMWNVVNGRTEYSAEWWTRICLEDYRARRA